MRLIIDTEAMLWFFDGNPSLSAAARGAMESAANERYISHATAREVAIKMNLGKLRIPVAYEVLFPGVLVLTGFVLLPPSLEHYHALIPLPRHHRDPFDRLIIAQAKVEGLTVVTCDRAFSVYGVPLLW